MERCLATTAKIKELAEAIPGESVESIKADIEIWQSRNNKEPDEYPSVTDLINLIKELRGVDPTKSIISEGIKTVAPSEQSTNTYTITYTPKGKTKQTYTIRGTKIYNKEGKEVFKNDSVDRYKIFANLAISQGRATVVTYRNSKYVVNNRDQIISVTSGKIMKWAANNRDRQAILKLAKERFASKAKTAEANSSSTSTKFTTTPNSADYATRTRENVEWSDVTIALAEDFSTAGERLTAREASKEGKYIHTSLTASSKAQDIATILYNDLVKLGKTTNIKLNIAGNGIYSLSQPQEFYDNLLEEVISILQDKGVTIAEIRSGGQTGIDEAGIIAAQRLGIPNSVHTTADFTFRTSPGKKGDISNEKLFKERFQDPSRAIPTVKKQSEAKNTSDNSTESADMLPENSFSEIKEEEQPSTNTEDNKSEAKPKPQPQKAQRIVPLKDQLRIDLEFTPRERRDRVNLISSLFSLVVDDIIEGTKVNLQRRLEFATSEEEKRELQEDLDNLTRLSVIDTYTPKGIFDKVKEKFERYLRTPQEKRIQAELDKLNKMKGADKYTDERKLEAATKIAAHKEEAFRKMVDNFYALANQASISLIATEGILININNKSATKADTSIENNEGTDPSDTQGTSQDNEESFKDGWMNKFREVSSYSSLSQVVRRAINTLYRTDSKGRKEYDDLGYARRLDPSYVHAVLMDKLKDMVTAKDMIPLLESLVATKPWVSQVIKLLKDDEIFMSLFYQDFRKDFTPFWIQRKKVNKDGSFSIETVRINDAEGTYYLLDRWRDNFESAVILDEDSVYDKEGNINTKNAETGRLLSTELINLFQNKSEEERVNLLKDKEVWDKLNKALHMVGIDIDPDELMTALTVDNSPKGYVRVNPVIKIAGQLNVIFSGIKRGDLKGPDGETKDLVNTFDSAYNGIALELGSVSENAIESSIREGDKTYYGHANPNYIGKMIKRLKNISNNKEEFEKFINEEFMQYDWFYDKENQRWRNSWIEALVNSEAMRRGLDFKVVLHSDRKEYQDWDSIDHIVNLVSEFYSIPNDSRSSTKWAWYHVPNLSDATSAEFIKFIRYTNGSERDEKNRDLTYQEIILNKLALLVEQEYSRIMTVIARDNESMKEGSKIVKMANYDIKRDGDGHIVKKGGSEFKFITELNSITFKDSKGNVETFLDKMKRLAKEGNPSELRNFIISTLKTIMEDSFERDFNEWSEQGVFDEENGKYKNLPSNIFGVTQATQRKPIIDGLKKAKELLGTSWTSDMENSLKLLESNKNIDDRVLLSGIDRIKEAINRKMQEGTISSKDANLVNNKLNYKNNTKELFREYYWNSKLATSQIIQILTTDLAFYDGMEDFQKRFKEVYSPSLRLNTLATWKGKRVGKDWERTIYLADNEIVSEVLEGIVSVITQKLNKGELSDFEAAYILSKYGYSNYTEKDKNGKPVKYVKIKGVKVKTSKVNVADAQAYRSLSSYRAIMVMSGQWTDDMETAYDNLRSGKWSMKDFNIIWQTKKPFVYTQINNESGIEGRSGIKTPVQHKNSEFLLLAMYEVISGPLNKSSKLRAVNKFMEENDIDVVQFESTTKVGKQGVIDINSLNNERDIIEFLKKTTAPNGEENPNFVHKISYEDYGIQVATPEHIIDKVQLIGTQIRKLIAADLPDTMIIALPIKGGKTISKTKKEWLDLYNEINTENILQSFIEIDEIFKDPKKVEEVLIDEIRSSARYSPELEAACTLDEDGKFNIPLYDPVQSMRVQALINSVIKNRIAKQKIKGGACIEVSSYGLTDQLHVLIDKETGRLKGIEVYMPAYSKAFFAPLMKNGSHELDINKLPEGLRRAIGYRVPTEGKYSMVPIIIKGFLPEQNGSAIMLPAEITTMSGSDYDVDKLYIMLPEFTSRNKYDMKKAWDDFYKDNPDVAKKIKEEKEYNFERALNELIAENPDIDLDEVDTDELFKDFIKGHKNYEWVSGVKDRFKEWFNSKKQNYYTETVFEKLEYDYDKAAKDQKPYRGDKGRARRNNALIDMMFGILTNPDSAAAVLTPGNFDKQKVAARINTILESMTAEELRKEGKSIEDLLTMSLEELDDIAKKYKRVLDPLSPMTQVIIHQQNMTGGKMIGIYANYNANHALLQHAGVVALSDKGKFTYNGKTRTNLNLIRNEEGEIISANNANYLAASVDNTKDNTLYATNQNEFTGNVSMLLSNLGYNPTEIAILMKQPIVMEMTKAFFREVRSGKSRNAIMKEVLDKTLGYIGVDIKQLEKQVKYDKFELPTLMKDIMLQKSIKDMAYKDKLEYFHRQAKVGFLFMNMMNTADAFSDLVSVMRSDAAKNSAGPSIADTEKRIIKIIDLSMKSIKPNYPIYFNLPSIGLDFIQYTNDIDKLREEILNSKLPYMQAFFSLGVHFTRYILERYFPQYSVGFIRAVKEITKLSAKDELSVKTMNTIYNELVVYALGSLEFFGAEKTYHSIKDNTIKEVTAAEKRDEFINHFPRYFENVKRNNPDIAAIPFIQQLTYKKASKKNPVSSIIFKNAGRLTSDLREQFTRDWASLLYSNNPEANRLALNLFRYCYFRNGLSFGPTSFIHLAPNIIRQTIPGYKERLEELVDDTTFYYEFYNQFIYNHLDNNELTKELSKEKAELFDSDEVTIDVTLDDLKFDKDELIKAASEIDVAPYVFVKKKVDDKYVYYKLENIEDAAKGVTLTYVKIEPLGLKNNYIEYEWGKDADEITSQIKPEVSKDNKEDSTSSSSASSSDNNNNNTNTATVSQVEREVAAAAYKAIYGESPQMDTSGKEDNDVTSLTPNYDHRDGNNDEICGAVLIKSF